jgi:hypothetical protein
LSKASVSPPIPGITPQDHERLLTAARDALALLDRMDAHAPEGLSFGGEGKVRRRLREAVRRCSFEIRPCAACDEGATQAPTRHPMEVPRIVSCSECGGSGRVRVYSYGPPKKARRG